MRPSMAYNLRNRGFGEHVSGPTQWLLMVALSFEAGWELHGFELGDVHWPHSCTLRMHKVPVEG